ncbi:MAG: hypothetical protein HYX43_13165 [Burkholderiales bacterium]|nr:hypothetical protein [Burkholderiales bacterium]
MNRPTQQPATATGPRILFVCDADTTTAIVALEASHLLCEALAAVGLQPLLLQPWPQPAAQTELRPAAKLQERPYTVYCSRTVRADAALLALVEQPTLAITLGTDPVGLAQPLLDGGLPCIAWFADATGLHALPIGGLDRRLGLAAASQALSAQLAAGTGTTVHALLPPISHRLRLSNGGDAVLIPSIRRVDGIQRVLEMARARPHIPFVAIARQGHAAAEQALLASAPTNVAVIDDNRAMRTGFKVAVLPALSADLPWDMLAHCLAAKLPVLASSEPLLEDAIGDAGMVIPASQPLDAWLMHLDQMMTGGMAYTAMAQAASERANGLRLPATQAAQQCAQLANRHARTSGRLFSGRL